MLKVNAYSQSADVETYAPSLEDAMAIYEKFKKDKHYYSIVVRNLTGEIVARYDIETNHDGVETNEWISNAAFGI